MGKTYNIAELEKITGIKAHTIRIWEKRYNLLTPKRTPTNIRYYDEQDLKKLLMVVILYKNGMRISEIAHLPTHRLQELVLSFKLPSNAQTPIVEQMLLAVTDFNQAFLNEIFIKEVINRGIENAFEQVIHPFLHKVCLLWLTDVVSCLHLSFAHSQTAKFLWQNLKFTQNPNNCKTFVTFSPQNSHNIPLLIYFTFLINKAEKGFIFLGQIFSLADIINSDKFKDKILLTIYNTVERDFYEPLKNIEQQVIIIDLYEEAENLDAPNITLIRSFDQFKKLLKTINN